jgi:hypothetical protein
MSTTYGAKVVAETLPLVTNGQTLTVVNNGSTITSLTKTGTDVWDTQAYSLLPFTAPCTIEFNKTAAANGTDNGQSYTMVGWNVDPTTNASYASIDHASYPFMTSGYQVYNNGTQIITGIAWDQTKKIRVVYDTDGWIRHWNGSTLLYSANVGTGLTVYFDSSFYSGYAFGSLLNVRAIKRSWNGTYYV